jgi:hypothetical protein
MYPNHNKIKQRLRSKEFLRYEYVESYKAITPYLLLYFSTVPYIKPIRENRFAEYEELFKSLNSRK